MPLDPNIPLQAQGIQLNSPLNMLARAQGVQNMQQQNELNSMQMQDMHAQRAMQLQQAQARQQFLANLPDPPPDAPDNVKMMWPLGRAGLIPMEKLLEAMRPKVARTVEVKGPDGKPYTVQVDEYGNTVGQNLPKWVPPKMVDLGGSVVATDETAVTPGQTFTKTATPDAQMSAGVAIRGQNMADSRAAAALAQGALPTYDATTGVWVDRGKQTVTPAPGGGGQKLTEDQGKATGWLVQAENAYSNMLGTTKKNPSAANPGVPDAIAAVPSLGLGETIAQMMRGPDRQKFLQGASSLSEALLRAATGAGITKDEAAQKIREITPQIGDGPQVIEQKMAAIPLYIESLKVRAGPGAPKAAAVLDNRQKNITVEW